MSSALNMKSPSNAAGLQLTRRQSRTVSHRINSRVEVSDNNSKKVSKGGLEHEFR
jgi:hypothetical protein